MSEGSTRFEGEVNILAESTQSIVDIQGDIFTINNQLVIHQNALQQICQDNQLGMIFTATKLLSESNGDLKSVPDLEQTYLQKFQTSHRVVYETQKKANMQKFESLVSLSIQRANAEFSQQAHHRVLEFLHQHEKSTEFARKAAEFAKQFSRDNSEIEFEQLICLMEYALAKFDRLLNQTSKRFEEFWKQKRQAGIDENKLKKLKPKVEARLTNDCLKEFFKLDEFIDAKAKKSNKDYVRAYVVESIDDSFLFNLKTEYMAMSTAVTEQNLVGAVEVKKFDNPENISACIREFLVNGCGFLKFLTPGHTLSHTEKHFSSINDNPIGIADVHAYLLSTRKIMLACTEPEFMWSQDGRTRRFTYMSEKQRVVVLELDGRAFLATSH